MLQCKRIGCFICRIGVSPAINILLDILRAATQPGDAKAPFLPVLLLVMLRIGIVNAEDAEPASHYPVKKGVSKAAAADLQLSCCHINFEHTQARC